MSYNVLPIPPFDGQLKRLNKKYPSLKAEYLQFIETLEKNPEEGTTLGNNCYKIRLAICSKNKGKSGGARIITHFSILDATGYLLSIYDKSDKQTNSDKELQALLKFVPE
jgi:hypothetical protein